MNKFFFLLFAIFATNTFFSNAVWFEVVKNILWKTAFIFKIPSAKTGRVNIEMQSD